MEMQNDSPEINKHRYPDYFYAGFWIRFFAYLVDSLCISALTAIIIGGPFNLLGLEKGRQLFSVYGILSLAVYLTYFILMTKLNSGQTLGKMIFGIRVICFSEENLSWSTVLVREGACRFILKNTVFSLGYLIAVFTPNKQHLGDLFSETSVVTLNMLKAAEQKGVLSYYE
ncbi:RDD family protein [Enterococcus pallens]|nr:RDD family protein [Enterococcus pallens]